MVKRDAMGIRYVYTHTSMPYRIMDVISLINYEVMIRLIKVDNKERYFYKRSQGCV